MIKLYKFSEKKKSFFYCESWVENDTVFEHVGQVGTKGRVIKHALNLNLTLDENIEFILMPARRGGYKEIPANKHFILVVEIKSSSDLNLDLSKRNLEEKYLNEKLGWLGLGCCDGGSIGSGTMEIFCPVVDFSIAENLLQKEYSQGDRCMINRIYCLNPRVD